MSGLMLNIVTTPAKQIRPAQQAKKPAVDTKRPAPIRPVRKLQPKWSVSDVEPKPKRTGEPLLKQHLQPPAGKRSRSDQDEPEPKRKKVGEVVRTSLFTGMVPEPHVNIASTTAIKEELFSSKSFSDLSILNPHLVRVLSQQLSADQMTSIQLHAVSTLLRESTDHGEDRDVIIRAETGSGKTLAYAVPLIQRLMAMEPKIKRTDGTLMLVVVPTRELAQQTLKVITALSGCCKWVVAGAVYGGDRRKAEKARLRKGINLLIATPGRLQDHLNSTAVLDLSRVQWLVLDEADRMLELGYQVALKSIIAAVPERRRTVLLSATMPPEVEQLAALSLRNPLRIECETSEAVADMPLVAPSSLKQAYIILPPKLRLVATLGFLHSTAEQSPTGGVKALLFLATQAQVDFFADLFCLEEAAAEEDNPDPSHISVDFFRLHGSMDHGERQQVFQNFRKARSGVLLTTDVGARGVDIEGVNLVVQLDLPSTPEDYLHRVGRTARRGRSGTSLTILMPSEAGFLEVLSQRRLHPEQTSLERALGDWARSDKLKAMQERIEDAIEDDKSLREKAVNAFRSWLRSYAGRPRVAKEVMPFHQLHLGHCAKGFGLSRAPSQLGSFAWKKPDKNEWSESRNQGAKQGMRLGHVDVLSEFDSGLPKKKK